MTAPSTKPLFRAMLAKPSPDLRRGSMIAPQADAPLKLAPVRRALET